MHYVLCMYQTSPPGGNPRSPWQWHPPAEKQNILVCLGHQDFAPIFWMFYVLYGNYKYYKYYIYVYVYVYVYVFYVGNMNTVLVGFH